MLVPKLAFLVGVVVAVCGPGPVSVAETPSAGDAGAAVTRAAAAGVWADPLALSSGAIDVDSVTTPRDSAQFVAWRALDDGHWRAQVSQRLGARAWSSPIFVSAAGVDVDDVSVSNFYGRGTIAWRELTSGHWLARASVSTPTGWSTPVTLSTPGRDAADPTVVGEDPEDRAGNPEKLLVWREQDVSGHWRVQRRIVGANGHLVGAASMLSPAGQDARDLKLGFGGIAWSRFDGSNWRAQVVLQPWGSAVQTVSPAGEDAVEPNRPSAGTVVWRAFDGTHWRVRTSDATNPTDLTRSTWATPVSRSASDVDAESVVSAPEPGGQRAVVAWRQVSGSDSQVIGIERSRSGWLPAVTLSTDGHTATGPRIGSGGYVAADAAAQISWTENDDPSSPTSAAPPAQLAPTAQLVRVARYVGGAAPAVATVSPDGVGVTGVTGAGGDAVIWAQGASPATSLTLRGFDNAGPDTDVTGIRFLDWRVPGLITPRWRGFDDWSAIATYDVRRRVIGWRATTLPPYVTLLTATRQSSLTELTTSGRTYCFQARARDATDKTGPWSPQQHCVVTPIDDRSLTTGPPWRGRTGRGYLNGTYLQSRTHGAVATLSHLTRVRAFGLLMATGPRQGRVRVQFLEPGGDVFWSKVLNLYSAVPHKQVIRRVISDGCCGGLRGRIVIKVVSHGRPVQVDGVFVAKQTLQ